jgi:hypothetical protein
MNANQRQRKSGNTSATSLKWRFSGDMGGSLAKAFSEVEPPSVCQSTETLPERRSWTRQSSACSSRISLYLR